MRVLVTGAGGYIGRHVVKKLLDEGHIVIASDFDKKGIDSRAELSDVPIFSGDKDIYKQLGEPDACIHMAWKDGFIHNSDAHMQEVSNHYLFLLNMIKGGLKRVSVMGTMHEIGYWEGSVDENTPCNPLSKYGIAKNALRQALLILAQEYHVNLYWLRAYYILGDESKSSSIFSKILQAEEDGKELFPFTSGKNQYDFIQVKKLAEQIVMASVQDEVKGIINVCTGQPKSLGQQVEEFIAEHNLNIRLDYGAFPDRKYDSPGVWGDPTKINLIMEKVSK
ncbi:NAD-dependent epimerase/dehydratase family protein [Kineothrix sp. MB12-C1]|uniref:NAD-dependent epimerase/dehydratase family protein n=1 Tax=Kineothrix sp. MB12-C1 TaxID=3070215 RepID=UPI0027D32B3B|nr:NAD(P)-dependent oxidoreductase [Kineothrix sp. MB12-C1]WMC91704.1 NAD(P)-dependent oxidoreductase [Kineothrix sp. MB12-C1]